MPTSAINLSVEASAADLAAVINQTLPGELYKGQGGLGTSVTVRRTGPVAVAAADNFVFITLPVALTFKYAVYESYPLRTKLRFKTRVSVAPDWRLQTELYYTGLADNFVDTFKIGPVTLKPKTMVENIVGPVQKLLAPFIDRKINESVPLKARIAPLWQNAFSPLLLNREFSTWLKLTPERIVMSPLVAVNDQIRLSIGVITGAEITVGPKPAATPARPLPPVQQCPAFDRSFRIQLAVDVFYADLVQALTPVLAGRTFGTDRQITVKTFDLKAQDGRLALTLVAAGDFDGELKLLARPVYNAAGSTLTFENVDFDTRDAGLLVAAGSWLLADTIRSAVKEKLDSAVAEQLENARRRASAALVAVPLNGHVSLTGTVRSLALGGADVQGDRLALQVAVQGEAGVVLK